MPIKALAVRGNEMGRSRGVYKEEYPAGTTVRVVERPRLEDFVRTWKLHIPLQPEQLAFAGLSRAWRVSPSIMAAMNSTLWNGVPRRSGTRSVLASRPTANPRPEADRK